MGVGYASATRVKVRVVALGVGRDGSEVVGLEKDAGGGKGCGCGGVVLGWVDGWC
jgi:hypothetical protein